MSHELEILADSLEKMKEKAKILKKFLVVKNSQITHSSCLEILALMNGFKDWNTTVAHLKEKEK